MKAIHPPLSILRRMACLLGFLTLGVVSAQAWPWNSEPQPLLRGGDAIRADAGSPLAWDQGARVLWYLNFGELNVARWTGRTFLPQRCDGIFPKNEAGLVADSAWHAVYFLDADGSLRRTHAAGGRPGWTSEKIGSETLSRLLAVDARTHSVFAYDPAARGIRTYTYDAKTRAWVSSIIASGLGEAGDAAACDPALHVIYSSHETADPEIPRHPSARSVGVSMAAPLRRG